MGKGAERGYLLLSEAEGCSCCFLFPVGAKLPQSHSLSLPGAEKPCRAGKSGKTQCFWSGCMWSAVLAWQHSKVPRRRSPHWSFQAELPPPHHWGPPPSRWSSTEEISFAHFSPLWSKGIIFWGTPLHLFYFWLTDSTDCPYNLSPHTTSKSMGGCDRHSSDSFWTFFLFLCPFIVPGCMLSPCSLLCCISTTQPAREGRASTLIIWLWLSLLSGSRRKVCWCVTLKGPSNHCGFHEHHSCLPQLFYLTQKKQWLVCGGNERYWEEIHWKRNYFLPKQKRCHNFREEIPDQVYGCYSYLQPRSHLWNFNHMSPRNKKCIFLFISDFCIQLKLILLLYQWDQIP